MLGMEVISLLQGALKEFVIYVSNFFGLNNPWDFIKMIIDIGLVSYIVYRIFQLFRETRAMQLVKGIIIILVAAKITDFIGLRTMAYFLQNSIQLLGFALIVVFQPELRRGLEQIGRSRVGDFINRDYTEKNISLMAMIEEIVKAYTEFSKTKTGALIVIERSTKLGEIVDTGIKMDAHISQELIENIFTPKTPLHDGAVIIRENRAMAASCFLPLTQNQGLSKQLGTRHRAALGITEISDAIAIVVSEETGRISAANNGALTRNLNSDMLRKVLIKNLIEEEHNRKIFGFRKVKDK